MRAFSQQKREKPPEFVSGGLLLSQVVSYCGSVVGRRGIFGESCRHLPFTLVPALWHCLETTHDEIHGLKMPHWGIFFTAFRIHSPPYMKFSHALDGAGGRTRTPDLLITNRSQPVRPLISWPFWHFPLGISRSLAVLFPLRFSARFPVWVRLWVVGRKRRKGGSKIGALKQGKEKDTGTKAYITFRKTPTLLIFRKISPVTRCWSGTPAA